MKEVIYAAKKNVLFITSAITRWPNITTVSLLIPTALTWFPWHFSYKVVVSVSFLILVWPSCPFRLWCQSMYSFWRFRTKRFVFSNHFRLCHFLCTTLIKGKLCFFKRFASLCYSRRGYLGIQRVRNFAGCTEHTLKSHISCKRIVLTIFSGLWNMDTSNPDTNKQQNNWRKFFFSGIFK